MLRDEPAVVEFCSVMLFLRFCVCSAVENLDGIAFQHDKLTDRQESRRRGARAISSLVIAGVIIWGGMMGLDTMSPRVEVANRPQFVSVSEDLFVIRCPGVIICYHPGQIQRRPTSPLSRQQGFAQKNEFFPPVGDLNAEVSNIECGDGLEFGWRESVNEGWVD